MINISKKIAEASPMKLIFGGYLILIFIGAVLLSLPIATKEGFTSFSDALFTATSAVCVTGLIRFDTFSHWTTFGHTIIIALIQMGGIGFMTIAVNIMMITHRKIGVSSQVLMQNSISAPQIGGITKMSKFITFGTLIVEGIGAILLSFYFCPLLGFKTGLYYSVFHSISAFCNAGFDLFGRYGEFSSLTTRYNNYYFMTVIMFLIIVGGLGFFVWKDILRTKHKLKNLRLHSKIVLSTSLILIVLGFAVLLFLEFNSEAFNNLSFGDKCFSALFQSVSARTAGFNSVELNDLTEGGKFVMMCLMLVGGSPGSTAGGMKTTTMAVIFLSVFTAAKRQKECQIFGRRIEDNLFATVSSIFIIYLSLICVSSVLLCHIEGISLISAAFECVSAVATVGLTVGITTSLSMVSKFIIIILMIIGRVGSLTVLLAIVEPKGNVNIKRPVEKIQVG